jgi:glycerophosphoryl diester phosphodiesterase
MVACEIIGHRGAAAEAPENTVAAFRIGYEQGADAVELDVHLTKDGKIAVIHDFNTRRTAGVKKNIARQSFDELRRRDVGNWGRWKSKGFSEKVPSLDEILGLVPAGKRLFIEIKCGPEILPELERALDRGGKSPEQTVIIGFGYETMRLAKAKLPFVPVCWLVSSAKMRRRNPRLADLILKARAARLDGLDLNCRFPIDRDFVRKVHEAGLKLYTWTVDNPRVARKEMDAGVDGITTNRPGWMREQLRLAAGARAEWDCRS